MVQEGVHESNMLWPLDGQQEVIYAHIRVLDGPVGWGRVERELGRRTKVWMCWQIELRVCGGQVGMADGGRLQGSNQRTFR
jgi:hypothetical protein